MRFSFAMCFVWVNMPFWIGCADMAELAATKTLWVSVHNGWSKTSAVAETAEINEYNRRKMYKITRFIVRFTMR